MNKKLLATTGCAVVMAFGLSACGGGGGGGGGGGVGSTPPPPTASTPAPTPSPTPTPSPAPAPAPNPSPSPTPSPTPTPTPTGFNTSEYQASTYAVSAGAITAYQAGVTGQGVKIGVIDSGINPSLAEFAGRIDTQWSGDVAGNRGVSDEGGHGTAVSAVAAAARNGSGTMGVAYGATIVSLRADQPGSCADTSDDGGCSFADSAIAAGIDVARNAGARVINMSLGGGAPGLDVMASIQRAVQAGIVIVISAGNDGETAEGNNPDPFALVPAQQYSSNVIIAGSVGVSAGGGGIDDSKLSAFSNKAGTGRDFYLTAVGFRDRAPDQTGTNYYWSGTSFSAPTISGAVALMAQAFPNLTGAQIVDILMQSADDLGNAGVDSTFGHGRLNIGSAFQPIGTTSLADSQVAVSTSSNGSLPSAAGDGGTQGSLGAIILDGYSRAYVLNLASTLRIAEQPRPLARALQGGMRSGSASAGPVSIAMTISERRDLPQGYAIERLGIGPDDIRRSRLIAGSAIARLDSKTAAAFGFSEGAKAIERRLSGAESGGFLIARDVTGEPGFAAKRDGSLAVRRNLGPIAVTLSGETGDVWQEVKTDATGSTYRWTSLSLDRDFGRTWLSAGVSTLNETQTLLGGRMGGALGGGGSTSRFLDVEARRALGHGWSASLVGRRGWTDFAGGRFRTGAYSFDLTKAGLLGARDRIGLRIAQPLRIENGGFALMLPTAYDYSTETATSSLNRFSLTPSGREIDAELSYGSSVLGNSGWIGGNLFMRRQPGHIAGADDDYGAALRFSLGF